MTPAPNTDTTATGGTTAKRDKPKYDRGGLKDARIARKNEVIGAGFFIFRRGDSTGRIRPALWPYEYPSRERAFAQAQNLATQYPGGVFEVFGSLGKADVVAAPSPDVAVEQVPS